MFIWQSNLIVIESLCSFDRQFQLSVETGSGERIDVGYLSFWKIDT